MLPITRLSRVQRAAALVASVAIVGLVSTSAAVAAPAAAPVTVTAFSPVTNYDDCGSAAVGNNATSGATLAAWSGSDFVGASAPLQVAIVGANGAVGSPATYQPDASHTLGPQGWCDPVSVDAGPNGGFIVTWTDADADNAVHGILVSSAGAFIGGAFTISEHTNYGDIETVSAAWSEGDSRYLVTWKAGSVTAPFPAALNGQQIIGRFIDATGVAIGADFLVTNTANGFDNSQDLAYGDGTWVAVSVERVTNQVNAVLISAAGVVSPPALITSPGGNSGGPTVVYNSSTNEFLIAAKSGNTLWKQLINPAGVPQGLSTVFVTDTTPSRPRIDSMGSAGYIATWHNGSGEEDVLAIELTTAGDPIGTPEFISAGLGDPNVEYNFRPEVAFSPSTGQSYIIWSRYDVAADSSNLVLRAWGAFIADPALAATGVDDDRTMIAAGGALLALLVGAGFVIRRRRATA